jgi:alkylation response protein AidB-like acyl-CoA dehydrogenase
MHFQFTEEQLMIQKAARDFAENECKPGVIERDEKQTFPKEQVMKLADLGFLGMMVPLEYGGAGMDTVSYVLAMEEISKWDASTSVVMSVNNSLVCYGLEAFGSKEQKKNILRRWHRVKRMVSFISVRSCLANPKQEAMQHRKEQQQKIKAIIIY